MKTGMRYGLAFGLALLLSLLATLPANQVIPRLSQHLPGVTLAGTDGTLFAGQAHGLQFRKWRADHAGWSLRILPLLLGRIEADLEIQGAGTRISCRLGRSPGGDLYLTDIHGDIGIKSLQDMGVLSLPILMEGVVALSIAELRWSDGSLTDLRGDVDITDLQLQTPLLDFGNYHIGIEPLQQGFQAKLSDRDAALQAQGVALINPDGSYRFTGSFAARANAPAALAQSLRVFGNPGPDGRVQVNYNGKL